jgi:hypothetical protein
MQVSVEFLGRTRILTQGREIVLSRQSISFLAHLVLYRELDHPRELMIEHFWSSHEPMRARSCLGTALSRLRKRFHCNQFDKFWDKRSCNRNQWKHGHAPAKNLVIPTTLVCTPSHGLKSVICAT